MHALSLNKIEAGVNKKRVGKIKLHFPDPVKKSNHLKYCTFLSTKGTDSVTQRVPRTPRVLMDKQPAGRGSL